MSVRVKGLTAFILGLAAAAVCCSCGNNNKVTEEEAEWFLNNKFEGSFVLKSSVDARNVSDKTKDAYGLDDSDILYTFTDEKGSECHVRLTFNQGMFGYWYNVSTDYLPLYVFSHPEYSEGLSDSGLQVTQTDTGYELAVESYEDIEPAVNFICDFVNGLDSIKMTDCELTDEFEYKENYEHSITVTEAEISLSDGYMYPLCRVSYHTDENNGKSVSPQSLIASAQEAYTSHVRNGDISGDVPDEVYEKYPADSVQVYRNSDKVMMLYKNDNSEYYGLFTLIVPDSGESGSAGLEGDMVFGISGWNKDYSGDSLTLTKDGSTVVFKQTGETVEITVNGQVYHPDTAVRYSGTGSYNGVTTQHYQIRLSCEELEKIFGITFTFNQKDATAQINL